MKLTAERQPIAIIGHPVRHSLSPELHNAAFEALRLPYIYIACEVEPRTLEEAVRGLSALGFRGANVTIPHKNAVVGIMDELTPQAKATQAVNTIVCDRKNDGAVRLVGDNTDVAGFVESLNPVRSRINGQRALVLGAGGAAQAVVYALSTSIEASRITVAARTPAKAGWLFEDLPNSIHAEVIPFSDIASAISDSTFVVNTTPVGMDPDIDRSPVDDPSTFTSDHVVYDLIYNPRPTRLLREAEETGATLVDGLGMLIGQASAAFERWTGAVMPVDVIRKVLDVD